MGTGSRVVVRPVRRAAGRRWRARRALNTQQAFCLLATMPELVPLRLLVLAAALLYSSVGHAGASGYLAAMALLGVSAAVTKPTALVLNVLVATIASA